MSHFGFLLLLSRYLRVVPEKCAGGQGDWIGEIKQMEEVVFQ